MNIALKEWDSQIRALETGRVALLFRKGGIVEKRGEFALEHEQFWLYPTFLHQNPGELQPKYHDLLRLNPQPQQIMLSSYAKVEASYKLENTSLLAKLEPYNPLTLPALVQKFRYRSLPYVHALLLRVYTCQPNFLEETAEYAGCVSWVTLEADVIPQQTRPVVPDLEFAKLKQQIEVLL